MSSRQRGAGGALFDAGDLPGCEAYIALRDRINERCRVARDHCEDLWQSFQPHAGHNFLPDFRLRLHERWFEMYLAVALERAGYAIETADSGPDICTSIDGRRVWIEATCAGPGATDNADAVPPKVFDRVQGEPINQTTLRILNSLDSKQRMITKYRERGTIGRGDVVFVAINIFEIPGGFENVGIAFERALFGFAGTEVTIEWNSGREVHRRRRHQTEIARTKTGERVEVQPFTGSRLPHISGVLASGLNVLNRDWPPARLGASLIAYPNLGAEATSTPCFLKLGSAVIPERDAEGAWHFRELDHELQRA